MTDVTTEYSLWLTLEEGTKASQRLQDVIFDLAALHEDAVVFEPHITVVGGVEGGRAALLETTRSLAAETPPLDVTFGDVRCSTTNRQCVFISVDPSIALFDTHRTARDALSLPPMPYFPHLSLVYSDMSFKRRLALAASIDRQALPDRARFPTVELVDTTGPVSEWESISTVQL
jgi:hypothetical protein